MKLLAFALALIAQQAGSGNAATTGYPECDRFIQMVSECIRTKMPADVRQEKQQQLDAFRSMIGTFISGPVLTEKCTENIRIEIQRDRYGCYTAHAAKSGVQTPCSLVTHAELEQILGRSFRPGEHQAARCMYSPAGGPPLPVVIETHWTDGRQHLAAARDAVRQLEKNTRTQAGKKTVAGRTVEGLGDDAYFTLAGFMPMLHVRKGEAAVVIEAQGASDAQLTAIARKAVERLR
ncbi:MAG: hypothetical protein WBC51_18395 [Vicinamibacterales bacterium]